MQHMSATSRASPLIRRADPSSGACSGASYMSDRRTSVRAAAEGGIARQQLLPCFSSQYSFATVSNESHQVFQQHAVSNRLHHMLNVYIRTVCWSLHCSELLRLLAEALRIWFCWAIYSVTRSAQRSCVKQQWTGTVLWGNNDRLHYFIHRHTTDKTCHSISERSIPFCTHRLQSFMEMTTKLYNQIHS